MSDAITITLPADLDPDIRRQVLDALPPDLLAVQADDALAPDAAAEALDAALATAPALGEAVTGALATLNAVEPGLTLTLLAGLAALAAGVAVERGAMRLVAPGGAPSRPDDFPALLGVALRWAGLRLAGLAVFAVAALATARLILPAPAVPVADAAVAIVAMQRLGYLMLATLAAPGAPHRRLAGVEEAAAQSVMRLVLGVLVVGGALGFTLALVRLGDPSEATRLARTGLALASALPGVAFFLLARRTGAGLIRRAFGDAADTPFARFLAANHHLFYALIAVFTALSRAASQLGLGGFEAAARSGMFSIMAAVLTPFLLAGAGLWRDARLGTAEPARRPAIIGVAALARGLIVAAAASFVLHAWGLDPFAPPREGASGLSAALPALVRTLFVVVVGVALWRAAAEALHAWGAPSAAPRDPAKPLDEESGTQAASRLQTVMPVLRGVALAAIGLTTAMLALGMLGVNTTPILAGAGVVGLAIGFGAQRMVQDVISGAFYLYEDAFRAGEYVECGQGKGVVEKISIRSVRLRHPRGPVFTVPFSAMGTIQNHSRDWVKVKFTFDVPQEMDLERVRKLVKKAGEALMADPELDGRFLEPMKSQGAVAIAGHAFTVGVKFVTRPGQQFLARRKAMAILQKTFADNGIDLMTPRIVLDRDSGPADIAKAMAGAAS